MRNERTFYHRECDSCHAKIIAYYPQNKPQVVWCPDCWYSDKLDPLAYGRDFDFSRPFFEQFKEIYQQVPTLSLDIVNCKDCQYVSYCGDDHRCYLDIAGEKNEDCYYCKFVKYSKSCVDCSFVYYSEFAYECVNSHRIANSTFLDTCYDSNDCHLSYDLRGCTDCFGCWNLRNKSYHIFNQPYSKEEYKKKVSELRRGSFATLQKAQEEFTQHSKSAIHKFAALVNCLNCTGDAMKDCKNVTDSFDVTNAENSRWLFDVLDAKECRDLDFSLYKPEFSYELISTLNMGRSAFCNASHYNVEVLYSDKCNNSANLFGCIAVTKKKYCIFNKQYSESEYQELRTKIIDYMKTTGEWGEFFPIGTSGFGYNETVAQEYFPLTKEEAERKEIPWYDRETGTRGKETMRPEAIPDAIADVPDSIAKEILVCTCGRNYRITNYELVVYRKLSVPIPHQCPECRHTRRNLIAGERRLWTRQCMKCSVPIQTSYSPERPEIVYCESCYQNEIL